MIEVGVELQYGSKVPIMKDVLGYPRAQILYLKHQVIYNSKLKGFKQSSNLSDPISLLLHSEWHITEVSK